MFKELFIKEVQESLLDYRSWIVSALCLMLIPLGMFVSRKDYESRMNEYKRDVELYLEESKGNVGGSFTAQSFRPPSQLSIFSQGFNDHLPHRVVTSQDGYFRIYSKLRNANLQSVLFGKIDFTFIVINFLSLLAIVFTFSSVSSEKEKGTIKLVLSNHVPRATFIIAKIVGGFVVFLAAFIVSFIIGLLIIHRSESINIFQPDFIQTTLIILFSTLLFLFLLFNLGTWVSAVTGNSINSVILLLFLWMIFTLGIPKVSPMIANIIVPVKSEDLIQKEVQITKEQLENERDLKEKELFESMVAERDIHFDDFFGEIYKNEYRSLREEYDLKSKDIKDDYTNKINSAIRKIENDHQLRKKSQATLAMNLSRLSPVGSYTFLISELSRTGLSEIENFNKYSSQFQDKVSKDIYNNYIYSRYWYEGFRMGGVSPKEEFDDENLPVPEIKNYRNPTLKAIFQKIWIDFIILFLFTIIFFYAAFVSFLRFDVR
jgi:ABC-type transport system involved in multi-copper enzyme maturation permease subunit